MLKFLNPAPLAFEAGALVAPAYGAPYYPSGDLSASQWCLAGGELPAAWAGQPEFVVLETGFGAGLNFLSIWAAWQADPVRGARLHVVSIEKHPFTAHDLAQIHLRWPTLATLSAELRAHWPMLTPGFHRIALDGGRVQLTLILGDVADQLPQVRAGVDAFVLDGFAPACNPEMWRPKLFYTLARLAKPAAVVVTSCAEPDVREGLHRAGFVCTERARADGLSARLAAASAWCAPAAVRHVAVVGAGVAGAGVAQALAQRGVAVTVLERAEQVASAASGNPLAVFRPLLARDDSRAARFTRATFLHALRLWSACDDLEWSRCGVLHLAKDAETAVKLQRAVHATQPPAELACWVTLDEARVLASWPVDAPGVFYPSAGWIVPRSLCRRWLAHPLITLKTSSGVARMVASARGWQLVDQASQVLVEADAVVLANARDALTLAPQAGWPLHPVRGQITHLPPGSLPQIQRVIVREGYVAPSAGRLVIGATYEHDDEDMTPRDESDEENLARLERILPGARVQVGSGALDSRASLRATLPDRFPLLGAVAGQVGVFVAAGYASRGVTWAGLLGETLADTLLGTPLPLEADLLKSISPDRFNPETAAGRA